MNPYYYISNLPNKLFSKGDLHTTMINFGYRVLANSTRNEQFTFMNYGYAFDNEEPCPITLDTSDAEQRYSLQLYHKLVEDTDLTECDILEVGSGRGGGSDAIARYYQPKSVVGVDLCEEAVKLSNRDFNRPGVEFKMGNAQQLPFEDNQFDVVMNLESSHCYKDVAAFYAEAFRVLKPGGKFLYSDFRYNHRIPDIAESLSNAGFQELSYEDISSKVVKAMDQDNYRRIKLLKKVSKNFYQRRQFTMMAGLKGSFLYNSFVVGKSIYFKFVMQKPY